MDEVCEVVVTAPDADWLATFSTSLIEDRLCACGHQIVPIRSLYRWQGRIEDAAEARAALHTRRSLVPAIIERVRRDHPFKVPCVVALPFVDGDPAYVQWILDETTSR